MIHENRCSKGCRFFCGVGEGNMSGRVDSNHRSHAPQTCALTGLSYAPIFWIPPRGGAKLTIKSNFENVLLIYWAVVAQNELEG